MFPRGLASAPERPVTINSLTLRLQPRAAAGAPVTRLPKGFSPPPLGLRGAAAPLPPKPMALAIALLLSGVLLPCWGEFALFKKGSTKVRQETF